MYLKYIIHTRRIKQQHGCIALYKVEKNGVAFDFGFDYMHYNFAITLILYYTTHRLISISLYEKGCPYLVCRTTKIGIFYNDIDDKNKITDIIVGETRHLRHVLIADHDIYLKKIRIIKN